MVKNTNEKASPKNELSALGLGYIMMAAMIIFGFLGHWADQKSGGGYKWTLVGLLTGLFFGLYEAWKVAVGANAPQDPAKKD